MPPVLEEPEEEVDPDLPLLPEDTDLDELLPEETDLDEELNEDPDTDLEPLLTELREGVV